MPRTIVVTGASSGVGLAAAKQLAAGGDQVVVVGRDPGRLSAAVDAVDAVRPAGGPVPGRFQADFERLDDVRALAGHLLDTYPVIDVLANNAGGMSTTYRRTTDGYEATLQANHLAPFLLTGLLGERVGRVVNTASDAHRMAVPDPDDLAWTARGYNPWIVYGASKAANVLFTAEAARRRPDVLSVCFHPGIVRTNFGAGPLTRLFFRYAPFLVSPENAAAELVRLATTPAADLVNGGYYARRSPARPSRPAADPALAARLWDASAKATGL